ncbi:MAG TPA: hypothetical protein VF761_11420 [Gemmatimonadaceae bacterium]
MRWRIVWRLVLLVAVLVAAVAMALMGEASGRQRYGLWLGAVAMTWIFGLELFRGVRINRRAE